MVRKVCLDSNILIGLLGRDEAVKTMLSALDAQFVITAVNSFEIWYGRTKGEAIFELFEWLEILPFDAAVSRLAADIMRSLKEKGEIIDLQDVFIAAICIKNDVELLTLNKKHFERLKKFGLILV